MALSNWDCLAFGTDGKPCSGSITGHAGTTASLYKNWLYLYNEKMWQEGAGYTKPCIAEVQVGEISIAELKIVAARHDEQSSIFVYVEANDYRDWDNKKEECMAGIGCYGFMDTLEWLEKNKPEIYEKMPECFKDVNEEHYMISEYSAKDEWGFSAYPWSEKEGAEDREAQDFKVDCPRPSLNDLWLGVTPTTEEAFFNWLKEVNPEYAEKIDRNGGLRFNQGNAFFANALGEFTPATKVGEKDNLIMNDILDKMEPSRKGDEDGTRDA